MMILNIESGPLTCSRYFPNRSKNNCNFACSFGHSKGKVVTEIGQQLYYKIHVTIEQANFSEKQYPVNERKGYKDYN
jgi:hypothetical protein